MRRFFRQEQKKPSSTASFGEESHQSSDEQIFSRLDSAPPIADLFENATIMFADIASFTAWSSERDPAHVFELLEVIFSIFDEIAGALGVFKISTIGDCYLAVSGVPDEREDHAEIMAEFASECLVHFDSAKEDLATRLGPETLGLELRIGINSGPVTAGVLRGMKARFEIFGDSVNTASRMESLGLPSKIQVSQATRDLLVAAGLGESLIPREGTVKPKGKESMQTYFLSRPYSSTVEDGYYCVIGKSDAHQDVQRQAAEMASRIQDSEHVCIPIDEEPLSLSAQ